MALTYLYAKSRYTFRDPPSAERSLFTVTYILLISSVSVIINWIIFERICTMYNICTSFLDLNNEVKYLSRGPLLHILHCWQISVKTSAKYLHLQSKGFNGTMARSQCSIKALVSLKFRRDYLLKLYFISSCLRSANNEVVNDQALLCYWALYEASLVQGYTECISSFNVLHCYYITWTTSAGNTSITTTVCILLLLVAM